MSTASSVRSILTAACAMWLLPSGAMAWDGAIVGRVSVIEVTGGTNFGVRVSIASVAQMCTGGQSWAYLNETDSNYKVYVAALLLAKAQGNQVTVFSNLEGSYCHIGYLSVSS
jgi:hypothetical protein